MISAPFLLSYILIEEQNGGKGILGDNYDNKNGP